MVLDQTISTSSQDHTSNGDQLLNEDQTLEISPLGQHGVLAFLPMLYVGWADEVFTPSQIDTITTLIEQQRWLTEPEKEQLQKWMDPTNPPSVADIRSWLVHIRQAATEIPEQSRQTLAELGLQMALIGAVHGQGYQNGRCSSPEACRALDAVEDALGVVSREALHSIFADEVRPAVVSNIVDRSTFDVAAMTHVLDRSSPDIRRKVRQLLSDPVFAYEHMPDKEQYRERVLGWCKLLAQQGLGSLGYPEAYGGEGDIAKYLVVMEMLSYHDLSLVIKFGVQFGLFGGSIHQLGTEMHHRKYLPDVSTLALPGSFAMTELGHGSNVRDIETIARYDKETQEFVIHTPSESARKEYIGNAARDGRLATVFAQLEIDGERYGVNTFLTPLRDDAGRAMPGITIEDNGDKMGLNGVDNGRIWFDHVRIPRENMLNRFAEVTPEGEYQSSIGSESRRFFTMLSTLVAGRVGNAQSALSVAKSSLTIALRYAARRRQFGPDGEAETLLIDYQSHQQRLMPLLANAYALDFALKYLTQRYANRKEEEMREIETLAAGLKAFSTWNTTKTIQASREACGGQGYLATNRFAALKADTDIYTTFEGDNTVLMQLVGKACLADFKQQFHDMKLLSLVQYIANQATRAVTEQNPVITRMTDEKHLHDRAFHLSAFRYREESILVSLAKRLKRRIDAGVDSYEAFIQCQNHLLNLAHAHVERRILEQFIAGIAALDAEEMPGDANDEERADSSSIKDILEKLCTLFALSHLHKHRGWYLEHSYLEPNKAKAIRRQIDLLNTEISQEAVGLVNAFGIPDQCLAAPIAL